MRIILTHEQADFDAVASQLGAQLLDERSIPVLPRRMNRNVRAFITLYGMELPFIEARDLPAERIEAVQLVDTQSMVSIKGMGTGQSVHVIDHHPKRDKLPRHWQLTLDETGANTTILVEYLNERDSLFTSIQATLMLLGIYEDTGSLTYTRTTSRDLRAAAYLLEHGANLQIASDFLNHPLSASQQTLYDLLRANAETIKIHGHAVILTTADAHQMDEELSTVAHKLRDLWDPDALFLLVTTRGGIQIIARSTNDLIDVAAIVGVFGGGGHERAAACLIRDQSIADVRERIIAILPTLIRPAITVSQIMSRDPQVLTPETSVEEAARRMQRYGYEGYPIAQGGKIIGLLTRRSVDRALSHGMPKIVRNIMDAGEHFIHPDDSIQQLQRVMTESGWGQIPVLDANSEKIIGIVTRTDLLKIIAQESNLPGKINLVDKLESVLPRETMGILRLIAVTAHEQHVALFLVGGFVRDLLLDRPSQDFDLVVEGDAIQLAQNLSKRYGGYVTSHTRFGTAKWHLPDRVELENSAIELNIEKNKRLVFDLVSARTEFYAQPTALPIVERGSIKLDLHRRDFTINTLALRLDGNHYGELHNYWGGLNDLRQGQVRVLHSLSFVDDPTRMLRAARFEKRFNFLIEPRTQELLKEALPLLDRISGDRIRHELDNILIDRAAGSILRRLHGLTLLHQVHPGLTWDDWLELRLNNLPTIPQDLEWELEDISNPDHFRYQVGYTLWLIRQPWETARAVCKRLKFSVEMSETIQEACQLWPDMPALQSCPASLVVERLENLHPLSRYVVYVAAEDAGLKQPILNYVYKWRFISPTINGNDLRARGLPPGPVYKHILKELRAAWLNGLVTNQEEESHFLEITLADKQN